VTGTMGDLPAWPAVSYALWSATCDTLHAHTQVLGKVAVTLAPPEPELLHAALRLTARGWETAPLPAPDGSGALVVALDLRAHQAVVEHSGGRAELIPLTPHRPVAEVTRDVLTAVDRLGGAVRINPRPQEVPWQVRLDEDYEHAHYDPDQVSAYFTAATEAALVLAAFRAPFRGRATPVCAWWGSFDLAVSLFSGAPADPPSDDFLVRNSADAQTFEVGWWPGDPRYARAAFYAFAYPAAEGFPRVAVSPAAARWEADLGEYLLDWDDVRASPDPRSAALEFAHSTFRRASALGAWDEALAATVDGIPPPLRAGPDLRGSIDARQLSSGARSTLGRDPRDRKVEHGVPPPADPAELLADRGGLLAQHELSEIWVSRASTPAGSSSSSYCGAVR
jgi:Family of unknown function (DUF5996)